MKRWKLLNLALIGLIAAATPAWSQTNEKSVRTWTSSKGTTLDGSFVRLDKDYVDIQPKSGKRLRVALRQLSPEDQEYALRSHFQGTYHLLMYNSHRATGRSLGNGRTRDERPMALFSLISGFSTESSQELVPRSGTADWHKKQEKQLETKRDKPTKAYLIFDPTLLYTSNTKETASINKQIREHESWARRRGVELILIDPIRPSKEVKYYEKGTKKTKVGGFTVEVPETIQHVRSVDECKKLMDEWIDKQSRRWQLVPIQTISEKARKHKELESCFSGAHASIPLIDAIVYARVFRSKPPLKEYKAFQSKGSANAYSDPLLKLTDADLETLATLIHSEVNKSR